MHKPINCNDDGPSTVTKFNAMGIESVYCCDHSTMNYAVTGKAQLFCQFRESADQQQVLGYATVINVSETPGCNHCR